MFIETQGNNEKIVVDSLEKDSLSVVDQKTVNDKLLPILDRIVSRLNPKNRWVRDYSDKWNFNSAYISARKNWEKDFVYNNSRYNTKNTASEQQQFQMYNNTDRLINIPVSQYTKEELKSAAMRWNGRKINLDKLNRLIDINTLSGNPSYSQNGKYKSPIVIASEYSEEQAKINNLTIPEKLVIKAKKLEEVRSDKKYMEKLIKSANTKSMYIPILNEIYGKNYIAEEAHGYRNTNEGSELMAFIKDRIKNPFISEAGQLKWYVNSKHFEYDTHQNVEPILRAYWDWNVEYKDIVSLIGKIRKTPKDLKFMFAPTIQNIPKIKKKLEEQWYSLKISLQKDWSLDWKWNEETKEARIDWQSKNKINLVSG